MDSTPFLFSEDNNSGDLAEDPNDVTHHESVSVNDDVSKESSPSVPSILPFQRFIVDLEKIHDAEMKLRFCLDFMRESLSQQGHPRFDDFWNSKKCAFNLFKEPLNAKSRSLFWSEYVELSSEAKALKQILDEQAAFAAEQIELAISALENDINIYANFEAISHLFEVPSSLFFKEGQKKFYDETQSKLNFLNALASRINALRKEVGKVGMKIRHKVKLFDRLSLLGDRVFPSRKELIKLLSDQFAQDIQFFLDTQLGSSKLDLLNLKDEIKLLQSVAKQLTLNTNAFNTTRVKLSSAWDALKELNKERKKEWLQKRSLFKDNHDVVMNQIQELAALCQVATVCMEEANQKADAIFNSMKALALGKEEVRSLKQALHEARQPIYDRQQELDKIEKIKQQELEKQKREKVDSFKTRLIQTVAAFESLTLEELTHAYTLFSTELAQLPVPKSEKMLMERSLKEIKDLIGEKKSLFLMNLSQDQLSNLENLKLLLEERKQDRQEIKEQIEIYRKALGGSGFDFERAMMYRELIETEKGRLEKANRSVEEIEEKISLIESS
ncbi:MAG: hypothetical protein ACOVOR_02905 [Rhabdochlamydiaceae bacterium]